MDYNEKSNNLKKKATRNTDYHSNDEIGLFEFDNDLFIKLKGLLEYLLTNEQKIRLKQIKSNKGLK